MQIIGHFKLGLLGFVIVITILVTIYSHRIYTPQKMDSMVETVGFKHDETKFRQS